MSEHTVGIDLCLKETETHFLHVNVLCDVKLGFNVAPNASHRTSFTIKEQHTEGVPPNTTKYMTKKSSKPSPDWLDPQENTSTTQTGSHTKTKRKYANKLYQVFCFFKILASVFFFQAFS